MDMRNTEGIRGLLYSAGFVAGTSFVSPSVWLYTLSTNFAIRFTDSSGQHRRHGLVDAIKDLSERLV